MHIFRSLVDTSRTLRLRRNLVKLWLYRHFTNALIFCVVAAVVFLVWSLKAHRINTCVKVSYSLLMKIQQYMVETLGGNENTTVYGGDMWGGEWKYNSIWWRHMGEWKKRIWKIDSGEQTIIMFLRLQLQYSWNNVLKWLFPEVLTVVLVTQSIHDMVKCYKKAMWQNFAC